MGEGRSPKMRTPPNDSAPACDRSAMLIAAREEGMKIVAPSQGKASERPRWSDASAPGGSEMAPRMAVCPPGSLISLFVTWTTWGGFPRTQQLLPLTHSSRCHGSRSPAISDPEIPGARALPVALSPSAWITAVNSISSSSA